jgi:hypothetical protein
MIRGPVPGDGQDGGGRDDRLEQPPVAGHPPGQPVHDREQRLGRRQQGILEPVAGDQAVEVEDGGVLVRVEGGRPGQADQQPGGDGQQGPAQRPGPPGQRREGAVAGDGPLLARPRDRDLQRTPPPSRPTSRAKQYVVSFGHGG